MGFKFSPGCTCCDCCNDFAKNHLEFDVDFGSGLQNGLCTECDNFSGLQTCSNLKNSLSCQYSLPPTGDIFAPYYILGGLCNNDLPTHYYWGCPNSTVFVMNTVQAGFSIWVYPPNSNNLQPNSKCELFAILSITTTNPNGTGINPVPFSVRQVWFKELDDTDWPNLIGSQIKLPLYSPASSILGSWQNIRCTYQVPGGYAEQDNPPPCTGGDSWPDPLIVIPQFRN